MFFKKIILLIALFITMIAFQNCDRVELDKSKEQNSSVEPLRAKANFEWINPNIIQPKCVACHNEEFAFSGLLMTSHESVLESIEPGEPESSPFYTRSFSSSFFTLTPEEQEIIYIWILNGAK